MLLAVFLSLFSACGVTRVYVSPQDPTLPDSLTTGNGTDAGSGRNTENSGTAADSGMSTGTAAGNSGTGMSTEMTSDTTINIDPSTNAAGSAFRAQQSRESGIVTAETVYFTASATRAMSNTMLANTFVHEGNYLYGSKHDENGRPYLCRMKFSSLKDGMVIRETELLESDVSARYLILSDGVLYYLREDGETGDTSIAGLRVSASEKSGQSGQTEASENPGQSGQTEASENSGNSGQSDRSESSGTELYVPETLYSGACDYLFLYGERLYFTDAENHLLSVSLDGKDLSQVVSDRELYSPYLISDDLLLYQDDADGESLHLRNLSTGTDRRIADGRVYEYVLSGSTLYFSYVEESTGMRSHLSRMELSDVLAGKEPKIERSDVYMGTGFSINGDHINGCNFKTAALSAWNTLTDDSYETGFRSVCQYVTESFEIFYNYDESGLIEKALMYEPSVKRASYFELS